MPRTVTQPPNDPGMWRRLVARAHPDAGGDGDLFVWAMQTRTVVCGGELGTEIPRQPTEPRSRPSRPAPDTTERVPFFPPEDFGELTDQAIAEADELPPVFGDVLRLLEDCYTSEEEPLRGQQARGATYKQLAAIAHSMSMTKRERVRWYRVAESIPLSQRHAGHLLARLKREAA